MKRLWILPIAYVFFTGSIEVSQQKSPLDRAETAHIEGIVLDGKSEMPLSGVLIGSGTARMTTMNDGRFVLDFPILPLCQSNADLANCNLTTPTLNASKVGYSQAGQHGRKLPGNPGFPLTLAAGERFDNFVVHMYPVASVAGKVFDPRGQPLQNAAAIPFRYVYNDAGTRVRLNYPEAKTNDLGEFRVNSLDSGDYLFEIRPEPMEFGATGSFLSPTFFPGVSDSTRAVPVHVEAGIKNQLANVTVLAVRGGILRVHVVNEAGEAPRGTMLVRVMRKDDGVDSLADVTIQKDSLEQIVEYGRLVPGRYEVRATIAGYNTEGRVFIVTGENDTQIDVPVRKALVIPVHGKAITEAAANQESRPIAGVQLGLIDISAPIPNANGRIIPVLWTNRADGSFPDLNRNVLPGDSITLRVKVLSTPPGMAVVSIRDGGREVLKDGLQVEAGREPNLTVILTESAGLLGGTATDAQGRKIIGGIVALVPDDPAQSHLLTATPTDLKGQFQFQAAPGFYHLYAWRELDGAAYYDPDFLKLYSEKGMPVRVQAGSNTNNDIKVLE